LEGNFADLTIAMIIPHGDRRLDPYSLHPLADGFRRYH
jgi:hypothetical protein